MQTDKYTLRRQAAHAKMLAQGLDALLVTHAANRFYLSGFELHDPQPMESSGCLILLPDGSDWLCTDARFQEAAKTLWPEELTFIYKPEVMLNLGEHLSNILDATGGICLGFEEQTLSCKHYQQLNSALPDAKLVPTSGLVENLRLLKDVEELELLANSCQLNQKLMQYLPQLFRVGLSESELAWEIEKYFREHGASELAFTSIVGYGRAGAMPHYIPSNQIILQENQPILIDIGARLHEYCSDQTRSFWFGSKPKPEFERAYQAVSEASLLAIEAVKPGLLCSELYHIANNHFKTLDCSEYFTHGLGHGIGLETHEAPSISPRNNSALQPGMVFTIEPGLYYPEWGGIRIEYMIQVTDTGYKIL